jgi:hypothetical protein
MAYIRKYSGGYGGWGRQSYSAIPSQLPSTLGSLALNKPRVNLRPARQYKFMDEMYKRAPLPVGTQLHVWIDRVVLGIREVAIGLAEVVDVFWTGHRWIVDLKVNGVLLVQYLGLEEVMAAFVHWHKKRRQHKRSEKAVLVGSRTPAFPLLPAPRNVIAGLLPATCAA